MVITKGVFNMKTPIIVLTPQNMPMEEPFKKPYNYSNGYNTSAIIKWGGIPVIPTFMTDEQFSFGIPRSLMLTTYVTHRSRQHDGNIFWYLVISSSDFTLMRRRVDSFILSVRVSISHTNRTNKLLITLL